MSPLVRWILAILVAIVLIAVILGVGVMGALLMAFGSDSCDAIGSGVSTFMLFGSPIVMALGVLVGAVLFGLKKRLQLWLGAPIVGFVFGVCGYVSWFALVSAVWCK